MNSLKLFHKGIDTINYYQSLPLDGKRIICPYYINLKNVKMGLRVLVGKGAPDEIVQESLIYEKLRGVDFSKMSEDKIREFMVKRHIGIDCSGFVTHVLESVTQSLYKKHIWKYLKFPSGGIIRFFATKLRPVENISVTVLTSDENSTPIFDLDNIVPGDLIRARGLEKGEHIAMITKVIKNENGEVQEFEYAQSSRWYGKDHGVRYDKVIVSDPKNDLASQEWVCKQGRNWIFEEISKDREYSQVRRLSRVGKLYE